MWGIEHDSAFGPVLFTLYTTPLSSLIHSHKLDHHLYADDTEVNISLSTGDTDLSLKQFGDCLAAISGWITNNGLRLNANKTDCIIISTSRQRIKLTRFFPTNIISYSITPPDTLYVILVLHLIAILIPETYFSDMSLLLLTYSWPSP